MKSLTVLTLGFVMYTALSGQSFALETIHISVGEWPPYVSSDDEHYGLAPKIVTEAFATVDIDVEYSFYPWRRAYMNASFGQVDATLLWVRTPEREKEFAISDVVVSGTAVFFHLKDLDFDWKTFADLKPYRIGGLASASYPWLEKARNEGILLKMDKVDNEEGNFKKLLAGRIDIFSLDVFTAYGFLDKYFTPEEKAQITYHPKVIEKWDYCLLVSKQTKNDGQYIMSLLNEGLQTLHNNGRYNEILNEYKKEPEKVHGKIKPDAQ